MTFGHTDHRKPQTFEDAVSFDRLPSIFRTCRKESALVTQPGRQRNLIPADHCQDQPAHTLTFCSRPLISSLAWSLAAEEIADFTRTTISTAPIVERTLRNSSRITRRARALSTALGAARRPTTIPSRASPSVSLRRARTWNRAPPIRRSKAPVNCALPLRRTLCGSVARAEFTQSDEPVLWHAGH